MMMKILYSNKWAEDLPQVPFLNPRLIGQAARRGRMMIP